MTARLGDKDKTSRHNTENRRANKPLMEKRRRARINQSLALLKTIVVDSNKIEASHKHSKLEKADILELTVKHLQTLQQAQSLGVNNNEEGSNHSNAAHTQSRFQQGFEECTREVASFLSSTNVDKKTAAKLLEHLKSQGNSSPDTKASSSSSSASPAPSSSAMDQDEMSSPFSPLSISPTHHSSPSPCPSLKSSESNQQLSPASPDIPSIHVIPTRLPNGRVVFLLPGVNTAKIQHPSPSPLIIPSPSLNVNPPPFDEDEPLDFRKARQDPSGALNLCKRPESDEGDSVWRPW